MGIQNLLPFLADSTRDAHISEFENNFVAVDTYCWLHKGIYSCAFELAMKKPSDKYIKYCMRYIEMLLYFKVQPIMVFDGRQLSSKSETEKKRKEERKKKYEKGKELMRAGKTIEGRKLLGESVDITHELALELMRACRQKNIDCIVAPYEADAQLAFFSIRNIVKCVITEDSDLLAYGCERVMFKMDTSGRGRIIEKNKIHLSLGVPPERFNEDIFRYMCILSGCDYLPSLPSIGPAFALKFIKMLKESDIYEALRKLPIYVNKLNIKVTDDYIAGFKIAENTFKHQLVYDPFLRKQMPLRPAKNDDDIVGEKLPDDVAFQLAVGNIDPNTMKKVDNFDPDEVCTDLNNTLWRTDSLPKAVPKQFFSIPEAKKRQREYLESDAVQSVTSDLKKQRFPLKVTSNKHFSIKDNIQKVPENGFIFVPKILNDKKNVSELVDKPKLLKSRYFPWDNSKERDKKQIEGLNGRRKDESYDDYLQRFCNEYLATDESEIEEPEPNKKKCYGLQREISNLKKFCSVCEKSCECCTCSKDVEDSESQQVNKYVRNIEDVEKMRKKSEHCLFDELYKNQSETSERGDLLKKDDENGENEEGENLNEKSLSQNLNANFNRILSKFDSVETDNSPSAIVAKDNFKVICDNEQKRVRTPSPVFRIQKESRIVNWNFRLGNISDTAGTSTSVYFPSVSSESIIESNSKVSCKSAQKSSQQKMSSVRGCNSLPDKAGKTNLKSCSVNKTLFQCGFTKQRIFLLQMEIYPTLR